MKCFLLKRGKIIDCLKFLHFFPCPIGNVFYLTHISLYIATARTEGDRTEVKEVRCGELQGQSHDDEQSGFFQKGQAVSS